MRITREDMHEASLALGEVLSYMGGRTQFFEEMSEKMDIEGEAAVETLDIIWESSDQDPSRAMGYTFFLGVLSARKAIGRAAEEQEAG